MRMALLPDLTSTGKRAGEERNQGPRINACWLKFSKYKQCSDYNQETSAVTALPYSGQ